MCGLLYFINECNELSGLNQIFKRNVCAHPVPDTLYHTYHGCPWDSLGSL